MKRGRIIVAARDAGGAAAVAPIARAALNEGGFTVEVHARGHASTVFERSDLPVYALDDAGTAVARLESLLRRDDVAALITGTSMRHDYEGALWLAASRLGIPSVAVLDHWCNYAERFSEISPFDTMPDVICVMDETARDALLSAGAPADRLRVTGQPYFDDLVARARGLNSAALRAELGAENDRPVVVFASEPQRKYYGDALGYNEETSLRAVVDALATVCPSALLYIKLHPLEPDDALAQIAHDLQIETRVIRAYSQTRLILAADVVCGMTSVFLLEAGVLGRPALSVRPNGNADDHFLTHHSNLITSVLEVDDVERKLGEALAGERSHAPGAPFGTGAVGTILELVNTLSRRSSRIGITTPEASA